MSPKYIIEKGQYGPCLVLTGPWSRDVHRILQREGIQELELNDAKGWSDHGLGFLTDLPDLIGLYVLGWKLDDLSPIRALERLKALKLYTYSRKVFDFSVFRMLERCWLEWIPGAESISSCDRLSQLFLNRYPGDSFEPFLTLKHLHSLRILNSRILALSGLDRLCDLRSLELTNFRRLGSLHGLQSLHRLEELEINGCRLIRSVEEVGRLGSLKVLRLDHLPALESIEALSALRALECLSLSDNRFIKSLSPLRGLKALREVFFVGGTHIVDGDLSVLDELPSPCTVAFQDRRHYNRPRSSFNYKNTIKW